jgi:aspartyl-tRNA(Asn)/glutamyl-tRNA(Gln) amidotransferase subunit C
MGLTREEVLHIARLARIGLDDAEVTKFQEQLSDILDHFQALAELDTEGVEPTSHPLPLESVMRDDVVRPSLPREELLADAPMAEEGALRVKAVLEE